MKRLLGVCCVLILLSLASWYAASREAGAAPPINDNVLAQQFGGDPGDGWRLAGGFLLLVAGAVACAGGMLWWQERRDG